MKKCKQSNLSSSALLSLNNILRMILPMFLMMSLALSAEKSPDTTADCGEVEIHYSDNPNLTRAEKLALMQQAFFESLNRFETCNMSDSNSSSAANQNNSSQGGNENSGAQGQETSQDDTLGESSVANQDMQGTEVESHSTLPSQAGTLDSKETSGNGTTISSGGAENGAIPEDIPTANNDDAIASQIRVAAEAEQDPEIKKKLWNEYRKYKGMTVVED